MKKFIARGMLVFLALGAILLPQVSQGCEIYDYSINRIKYLDCGINKIEEDVFYMENIDYYVGYIKGQREAFYEIKTVIESKYPIQTQERENALKFIETTRYW